MQLNPHLSDTPHPPLDMAELCLPPSFLLLFAFCLPLPLPPSLVSLGYRMFFHMTFGAHFLPLLAMLFFYPLPPHPLPPFACFLCV